MIERLLIVLGVMLLAIVTGIVWRLWQRRQLGELQKETLPAPLVWQVVAGQPAVLYFTSDGCAQCKFQQTPILERLAAATGIPVHTLDAVAQADLADFYGVMTLPTTVVLDRQRRPVAVNYGIAPLQKLHQQVEAVG